MSHHPNRALSQKEMEARRVRAVPYFKKKWSERRIAEKLGVSGPTVHDWKVVWQKKGAAGLRAGAYGRRSKLSPKQESAVRSSILKGAAAAGFQGDFWTLTRLTILVKRQTRKEYKDRSVWHVMGRLGLSCQKPVRRSIERDEGAIRTWVETTWPQAKRGRSGNAQSLAFSTKQASPTVRMS